MKNQAAVLYAPHDVRIVDRRVRGDDRDAVIALGLERRRLLSVELWNVRVVIHDLGSRVLAVVVAAVPSRQRELGVVRARCGGARSPHRRVGVRRQALVRGSGRRPVVRDRG